MAGFIGGAAGLGLGSVVPTTGLSPPAAPPVEPTLDPSGIFGVPPTIPPEALLHGEGGEPIVRYPALERAAQFLQEREVVSPGRFYTASRAAREASFTISGNITKKAIEQVNDLLIEGMQGTTSRTQFLEKVTETLPQLAISEAHLEHVYRNAINEAYSQGMETVLENPVVADGFPYRLYVPIHDDRTRPTHLELEHLGLNGTAVYYYNDPMWQLFRPPWEWQCRCGWIALSIESAASMGVKEAQRWQETGLEPEHPPRPLPDFRPPESWQRISI